MPPSRLRAAAPLAKAHRLLAEAGRSAAAGDAQGAEAAYRRALALSPDFAEAWNNLGAVLSTVGRFAEAAECHLAALSHGLIDAAVFYNLAGARKKAGLFEAATRGYRRALALRPDYAEAWNNLANVGREEKNHRAACSGYLRALAISPGWEGAHDNLSAALYLLSDAGSVREAAALAGRWRRDHPDNPSARHLGAALTGEAGDARASDDYVRSVFDGFAADFDERLAELGYRAPALLAEALTSLGVVREGAELTVLDAGCGTGLCGPSLRACAARLDGVDLSPGMLARAAARGVYDRLEAAELTAFLQAAPGAYDLIVAADVFCYFGVLDEALAAAAAALTPGGALAFSVERGERADGRGHVLQTHGRYAHDETALRATVEAAGLAVAWWDAAALRSESGRPVTGLRIVVRRPPP